MKRINNGKVETVEEPNFSRQGTNEQSALTKRLNRIKPVLRKNCFNQGNNVIVSWRSFEIWLIKQENNSVKIQNPIYIPLEHALKLADKSTAEIEAHVIKSLKQTAKTFVYQP